MFKVIKAIFFDLDGTLLTNRSKVLPSTKRAIEEAQAQGILCGIATARSPVKLKKLIKQLHLDMFVMYNGQLVYTPTELVVDRPFQEDELAEVIVFANKRRRQVLFEGREKLAGSYIVRLSLSRKVKWLVGFLPQKFPVIRMKRAFQRFNFMRPFKSYWQLPILQVPIYQVVILAAVEETPKLIRKLPLSDLKRSNPYLIEIIPKGGSKFQGIQAFLAKYNIELAETMAFGDHLNDIEMLEGVGIGVAMGNAQAELKAHADYVTTSNQKDGIASALTHFQVIRDGGNND
jgi:Cof subfamily protein (haloacid dehalogenase superfamily)